ncbi:iron ABC transporter permease [Micromonospora sp. WMMD1082]|uniref:FecCD family ABC transporter permease n=1 Tax=Micromonospora sp. WMMD1082 TaxID=3016104 RepID=UPI002416C010|nr:iron ABC transporter permease [Micromonospora sp. WMMD1082]MDG4797077.1 iron ABC transporter permease [Micromonospora sp. WMMD1082]
MTAATRAPRTPGRESTGAGAATTRRALAVAAISAALLLLAVLSTGFGAVPLTPAAVVDGMFGGDHAFIVQQYRLPRIGVCVLAGAALAVAGMLLQSAVRNALASPDVVGVTKGAGLGAMIATVLAPPTALLVAVPVGVVAGALLVTLLLLGVARLVGSRGATLALVGVAIAAIAGAAIQYLMVAHPGYSDQAMVWLAGSVYGSTPTDVAFLAIWLLCCTPFVLVCAARLDLAAFDDDTQGSLGVAPVVNRTLFVCTAVALTAGAVSAVGGIGFLGLLAPHLARLVVGPRARWCVPTTALLGAMLLTLADLTGRLIALPNEIPAGIVAAIAGGPYLLFLLFREARRDG